MKARELRELTVDDLREKETQLAEQLFALRLQKVTGQLDNPVRLRHVRRDLARVLTVVREKSNTEGAE
jgi:large subunit ribosomal protein L29